MELRNTTSTYGVVAVCLHWLTALVVFGLFGLGLWMVDLTYYDSWYQKGPDLHRGLGILLAMGVAFRLGWRLLLGAPAPVSTHDDLVRRAAALAHGLLYALLFAMFASGYLISTAKGQAVEVFGWFEVPALVNDVENLEDLAGQVHEWLAYSLIALVAIHAGAALKHHFMDRDDTLKRMFGRSN